MAAALKSLHSKRQGQAAQDEYQSLDINLLCVKLEAAKRQQDVAWLRRQKRETVKNGKLPRTDIDLAPTTVNSTAAHAPANTGDARAERRRRSRGSSPTLQDKPRDIYSSSTNLQSSMTVADGRVPDIPDATVIGTSTSNLDLRARRRHSGSGAGPDNPPRRAAPRGETSKARRGLTVDSYSPNGHNAWGIQASIANVTSTKPVNGLQTKIIPIKSGSDIKYEHVGLGRQTPTTAVKEKPKFEDTHNYDDNNDNNSNSNHNYNMRPRATTMAYDFRQNVDSERLVVDENGRDIASYYNNQRPPCRAHNRPDWTQQSETGEDSPRIVRSGQRKAERSTAATGEREGSGAKPMNDDQQGVGGNLISDAVARIKEEQQQQPHHRVSKMLPLRGFFSKRS